MGRRTKGWKVYFDPRRGSHFVRFTHEHRRYTLPTGERNPSRASTAAATLYAEVISGRRALSQTVAAKSGRLFEEVAAEWLADVEPTVDKLTFKLYRDVYVGTHFAPFFETVDRLTTVGSEDYTSARLRKVKRETVKKELTILRRFARWAKKRGYLSQMPEIEVPGHRVLGTKGTERKTEYQIFTEAEIDSIVAQLPLYVKAPRAPVPYPVRARFEVAWETALRPATLNRIRAPEDYRKGADTLIIREEADKARFGRDLPLSARARAALDSICPEVGLIFGDHDYRVPLARAATRARIDKVRAERISDYDFRHSRLTQLGTKTDNLSGVMYLAGHKQPATTARYMRPQKAAARDVLEAAANDDGRRAPQSDDSPASAGQMDAPDDRARNDAGEPGYWLQIGCTEASPATGEAGANPENTNGSELVRGGGLEPPWLLTASTSI
jgi:integrase